MRNLSFVAAICCLLVPSPFALADVGEVKPSLEATPESQGAIPQVRVAPNEYDIRIVEYKELSNTCLEIYKEHLRSFLTLITVGAAILGYAISSRLTRRALIFGIAVGLGLCWFSLARHINYSRTVRAPMEYRLYDLERDFGIKVWRTSRPLMVYMWEPPASKLRHSDEIKSSRAFRGAKILGSLLLFLLVASAIGIIFLAVWATVLPYTHTLAKPEMGERRSEASDSV